MLNVWVKYPENESLLVNSPKIVFSGYMEYDLIDTDLGRRIVKDTSKVSEIFNCMSMRTEWGYMISPEELSDGAKILLLMLCKSVRDEGFIFNYTFCGDNCNKYLKEIAEMYDVNIYLGRFFLPFQEEFPVTGVHFSDSGVDVYNANDYLDEYFRLRESR